MLHLSIEGIASQYLFHRRQRVIKLVNRNPELKWNLRSTTGGREEDEEVAGSMSKEKDGVGMVHIGRYRLTRLTLAREDKSQCTNMSSWLVNIWVFTVIIDCPGPLTHT